MTDMHKAARQVLSVAEPLIETLVTDEGCELVDVTYHREPQGWVLRVYIDRTGGVTIADCQSISRQLGDMLEARDVMRHAYTLEVSSPGLNRPLKKAADFERFAGQRVRVKTKAAVQGRRNFLGKLLGCADGLVQVDVDGTGVRLPLDSIGRANIEYDFSGKK
ncbi:MAG: ribosome maturation factor RimP [Deltaproteobacteria bacterium]|nr:ribosome maturation factor RimP [Deltaproteobacteria bacterium]